MKTKPNCAKKLRSHNSKAQDVLLSTKISVQSSQIRKNSKIQTLKTHTSMKSEPVSHFSSVPKLKKQVTSQRKSNKYLKKSSKPLVSIKLKKIGKIEKLKIKPLKQRKIKKQNTNDQGQTTKSSKKMREKKRIQLISIKQENMNETKSETFQIPIQILKSIQCQEEIRIDFDDNAQIRMFFLSKEQILTKRQNLLSRNIEDWAQLSKIKIQSRELRNLNL